MSNPSSVPERQLNGRFPTGPHIPGSISGYTLRDYRESGIDGAFTATMWREGRKVLDVVGPGFYDGYSLSGDAAEVEALEATTKHVLGEFADSDVFVDVAQVVAAVEAESQRTGRSYEDVMMGQAPLTGLDSPREIEALLNPGQFSD